MLESQQDRAARPGEIEYTVTIRVLAYPGLVDPWEDLFYESCPGFVHVIRAKRETPPKNMDSDHA